MLSDAGYGGTVTTLPFETEQPLRHGFVINDVRQWQTLHRLEAVNREAATLIDSGAYDVALVDACRFTFAPQILRYLRTPSLYYCHHGPWRSDGISEGQARSLYETARDVAHLPLRQRLERKIRDEDRQLTRMARAVATNSAFTRQRLREACGIEAELCPPGIEIPPRRPKREGGYVLSVGDLVPHKGHDLVVRALAALPAPGRPALHIVANSGGRTYVLRLQRMARELGVALLIREAISDADLEGEYGGAYLYAFGARREPLGLAPLEAMANILPVVAVNEGGVPETVSDGVTGFLVPADPAAMANRIAILLGDAALRSRMGEAGRAAVEKLWSRDHRAVALESVLSSLATAEHLVPA